MLKFNYYAALTIYRVKEKITLLLSDQNQYLHRTLTAFNSPDDR